MYCVPFSKGHRPPREGSGLAGALDPGNVELGFVMFKVPEGMREVETESPVGVLEGTPDTGTVELVGPIGTTDEEPEMVGPDLGGSVDGTTDRVLAVDGVEVDDPPEAFEAELELATVALEEVEEPGGALEDNEILVVDEVMPLEAGAVLAPTCEVSSVTVVVILREAVPEMVAST